MRRRLLLLLVIAPMRLIGQSTSQEQAPVRPAQYHPVTERERLDWFMVSTLGPASLVGGLTSAGWGTLFNLPKEYGTHWQGFGQRYGMRLTGIATSNAMEAGLGAIWGEDPRYPRAPDQTFRHRVVHVVKWTFLSRDRDGQTRPAYARYAAVAGSNYLSNTWRADSEATTARATLRIGLGFLGRLSGNAFDEFWPDARNRIFHGANGSK